MCGEQIAKAQLGLEAAPTPRSPVRVKSVDDERFAGLPITLYEMETERSGTAARGLFTLTGGDCRLIAGDLSAFLGVPMSSAHAASQAATAYNLALEYGPVVRLTEPKDLLDYAYRVVALATPEVSGRQQAELRLLAKRGEIQKLAADKGPACKLGRSRRKKELRKASEVFSEPKIVQTPGGSVLNFFTWISAGGHVVRQEVFVGGDGHISLQSETVATHIGAHRD
jgi:hypothetical protein